MKKICYSVALGLLMVGIFVLPQVVLAASVCKTGQILPECVCDGNCNLDDFVVMFVNLITFFLGIVAIIALYYFVNGAFMLVISSGSPEKIASGKSTLVNALVGLFVVLSAWVMINTLFMLFTGSDTVFGEKWWKFKTAPATEEQREEPAGGGGTASCENLEATAASYNVPYPAQNAAPLDALINCIKDNVQPGMIDENQIYTIDRDHPSCNYTRGDPKCETSGVCSHSHNSCHYGGFSGIDGAMGVDFNAKAPYTEYQLAQAILQAKNGPCDGLSSYYLFENNTHTHLNATGCGGP
ncbi:MAG: pilin [Patescibacteria group bacterium]|nr:pilin [Patescibacteria group bacterium]